MSHVGKLRVGCLTLWRPIIVQSRWNAGVKSDFPYC